MAAPERWDEACFLVPALRAAAASGLATGVLCHDMQEPLWRTLPGIEVLALPLKSRSRQVAAGLRGRWRASLAWERGFASEVFHRAAVPRRLGPAEGRLGRHLSDPLDAAPGPLDHRVRFYLNAVEAMGIETRQAAFFAPAEIAAGSSTCDWLLVPDSDFGPSHEWLTDRWEGVARHLLERGKRVAVLALARGRGLGDALAGRLGLEVVQAEPALLAERLPDLAAARRVLAADGSVPHLAAHVGATCVTLFGPNDPDWKRPLGRRHLVARRHTECAPCLMAKCPLDRRCQTELDEACVLAAIGRLLSADAPTAR